MAALSHYPVDQPIARLLLLHGAGAPVQSGFFQQLIPKLNAQQIDVFAANFAFMQAAANGKRQVAPKADKLLTELAQMLDMLEKLAAGPTTAPIWLAGKSLGGRVISLYLAGSAVSPAVQGGVVFGYPLCPPAQAKDAAKAAATIASRSHFFQQLQRPLLICQGSRDPFGSAAAMQAVAGRAQVLELPGADHDFVLPKRGTVHADQAFSSAAEATAAFIRRQ